MRIGNVITDEKVKLDKKFNISNSLDDIIDNIPTLIIGLDNAKKLNTKLNYLERKIDDKTFWTFNKKEKRVLFEEDLFYFIEHSYNLFRKKINYKFVDMILSESKYINYIFDELSDSEKIISFINLDMVYVFLGETVYGFDLRQVTFRGRNKNTFIDLIKSFSDVFLDDEQILIEYKNELSMFNDEIKYVPLIYSIRNND
jgi:hypothetical protein